MTLRYGMTNEDLQTIIAGLSPTTEDRILAICGSGDQAFALAEYGPRIYAVDYNEEQIDFAQERVNALRWRRYRKFLGKYFLSSTSPKIAKRNAYFQAIGRLRRIRRNLARIQFMCGDLEEPPIDHFVDGGYNKIYASNAIGYHDYSDYSEYSFTQVILSEIVSAMPTGGLLYVSNSRQISHKLKSSKKHIHDLLVMVREFPEEILWTPAVYSKRAN